MMKFKKFVTEQKRFQTVQEIQKEIEDSLQAGEILNPDFQNLKFYVAKLFEIETEKMKDILRPMFHKFNDRVDNPWLTGVGDIYNDIPYALMSIKKFDRAITKLEKNFKKYEADDAAIATFMLTRGKEILSVWMPIAEDMKTLKGKVVKVTQKRAEAKRAKQKIIQKKVYDSRALINALEQNRQDYVKAARKRSVDFIDGKLAKLRKVKWDLNKIAPYRSRARSYEEQERAFYERITERVGGGVMSFKDLEKEDIRTPYPDGVKRFIDEAVKTAEANFDAFILKMVQKIGKPVKEAKMTGSIWTNTKLTVVTDDDEEQIWTTKVIINFSKYNKMFNQFPTRRKK